MKEFNGVLHKLIVTLCAVPCTYSIINVTLIGSTERHVCKRQDIDFKWTYFKWTYDDTDPDMDLIKTIQWSKDPSGYLIMQYQKAINDLYITSSPIDYTGRVQRTTEAGSNDIGMRLRQVGSTTVNDDGKYYVSLIVDKPGGDANDAFVPYRDPQGVHVYVCVGVDDTHPLPSLILRYDENTHIITCSGPSSLGDTTFAIFDPSMNTVMDSTTDIILSKDITADRPGGTYRCKTYCTQQGYDDTPQGTCLPTDATLVLPGWSSWDDWTSCSTPATLRMQTRDCSNSPLYSSGPQNCPGVNSETEICPTPPPAPLPVNGAWGDWTAWTTCSVTCDNGTQTRNRECDNPPPIHGGDDCTGPNDEIFECFKGYCPAETTGNQPEVYSVWPTFGPQSGGTAITVRGKNLHRHSWLTVYVGPKECTIVYINATVIIAHTLKLESDEANFLDQMLLLYVTVNNSTHLTSNAIFTYRRDPVVDSVFPKESIVSGGTFITARGSNFYSVAVIKMETTMILKQKTSQEPARKNETRTVYITDCDVQNETQMICVTASIELPDVFINRDQETKRKRDVNQLELSINSYIDSSHRSRKRRENPQWVTHNGDYTPEFYIGFRLDGVDDHTNFSPITIHTEPLFSESGLKWKFTEDTRISFKGEHLDRGVTVYDYAITVGAGTCTAIELLSNTLSCLPPQTEPANASVSGPQIIIHIGLNVDHFVGHLIYPDEQTQLYLWILVGVLPSLLIIVIIVTVGVCVKKRQNNTQ